MYACIGRHCCLWCNATSEQLKISRTIRKDDKDIHITQRSLQTLAEKYSEFLGDGANIKKAKLHDNVIGEAFFDIPLSQVKLDTHSKFYCDYGNQHFI